MPRLLLAVGRPAGGRRRLAAGGRRPPPAKPKPGPKAPALWALCAPAAPPAGPQRFPQPWRKRGAAAAAASRKGTRQAQGLGARIGCAAPPMPLRWTRGLGYPGRPRGAAAFGGRGPSAPRPAKPKPGPKAPALWALRAPAAPPAGPQRFPKKAGQRQTVPAGENLPFSR